MYVQVTFNAQGAMNSLPTLSFIYPLVFNNNNFRFSLETYFFFQKLGYRKVGVNGATGQYEPRKT